ncbi:hypothetical protein I540_1248 [Mycobacteroides abscessus subsp. bolletii 1513]|uniref:Uncharacterized protein n=1 Tax=Mycobacteroides abscessus subsp. bolletii 1513 TaxID=1299321 RepID=X8DT18_9MYCO|nr:hypothetical protein I540_1248 [Mycobacteroides abscessus subsp. bolletii 1513]
MSRITNVFMGASIAAFASAGLALGLASTASADPIPGPPPNPTNPAAILGQAASGFGNAPAAPAAVAAPAAPALPAVAPAAPPFRVPLRPPPRSRRLRVWLRLSPACLRPPPRA